MLKFYKELIETENEELGRMLGIKKIVVKDESGKLVKAPYKAMSSGGFGVTVRVQFDLGPSDEEQEQDLSQDEYRSGWEGR